MSIEKINMMLSSALERKKIKAKLDKEYSIVKEKFESENKNTLELYNKLKKEEHDVDRFENLTLTSLFYTMLGSKEKQLEKERQEKLATQLKYEQSKYLAGKLRDELMYLQFQARQYKSADQEYDIAIQEKEDFLKASGSSVVKEIVDINTKIANHNSIVRETNEAIVAGVNLMHVIEAIIGYLTSAQNWGTWDIIGGGLWVTARKHAKIGLAKSQIFELESSLGKFKREL